VVNRRIARNIFAGTLTAIVAISANITPALAQDADNNEKAYAAVLDSIADKRLSIIQKEAFLDNQAAQIESLKSQLAALETTQASVDPLIKKMAASIKTEIEADVPFREADRYNRLRDFEDIIEDKEASISDKFRRALHIYDVEVSYGNSVEAYRGDNPKEGGARYAACLENQDSSACGLPRSVEKMLGTDKETGLTVADIVCIKDKGIASCNISTAGKNWLEEKGEPSMSEIKDFLQDGHFVHYGRLALIYLEHDSSSAYRYDGKSKEWVDLSGSDVINVRRGMRGALGETAPVVAKVPVHVTK